MGLSNFEAVWERVRSGGAKEEPRAETALRHFIEREAAKRRLYEMLAQQSRGGTRIMFSKMCESAGSGLKELELELFLLSGDSFAPSPEGKKCEGFLPTMRRLYISEQTSARELEGAADEADGSLRDTYLKVANASRERRDFLRRLLSRVMS